MIEMAELPKDDPAVCSAFLFWKVVRRKNAFSTIEEALPFCWYSGATVQDA